MKKILFLFFTLITIFAVSQNENIITKSILLKKDTIKIDSVSITPFYFSIIGSNDKKIDTTHFEINYTKSYLIIKDTTLFNKKVYVTYQKYPNFLTKKYQNLDTDLIVDNTNDRSRLYRINENNKKEYKPFKGLETKGNISRGITMGNNQDGVLDSNLKLQIQGNLSSKVRIRANIIDSNIPIQNNGYTQRLDQFDRVFVELFTDTWRVTAGDVDFKNQQNKYLNFTKRVSGISVETTLNHKNSKTELYTSGALVRGQFTNVNIIAENANQGPYRLTSPENTYWLLINDSETVFIDGIPLKKGKNQVYTIDYNTAEITFKPTFPINANMRIYVEFQISDQNFVRLISFNSAKYSTEKSNFTVRLYHEADAKNSNIQQNLNDEQREILANAGDDETEMFVPNSILTDYDANKILYKKSTVNGIEIFEYSTDENETLYQTTFTYVGENKGNYQIQEIIAIGKIYQYVEPISGIKQGDYEPITPLKAPNSLQVISLESNFNPNEKIAITSEIAFSNYDKNLFSNNDKNNDIGYAGKLEYLHTLLDKKWKLKSLLGAELLAKDFNSVERIQQVEFFRNWNLQNITESQKAIKSGFILDKDSILNATYTFENLQIKNEFNGMKHSLDVNLNYKNISYKTNTNLLNSTSNLEKTNYLQTLNQLKYQTKNKWIGVDFTLEQNSRKDRLTNLLNNLSFTNNVSKYYTGFGDKNKLFFELGYLFRVNDSLQNNKLKRVDKTDGFYIDSQVLKNKNTNLTIFTNYEINNSNNSKIKSLNTRINYRQNLFKNIITFSTIYETNSSNLPQQDFAYIKVEPGQGYYQWIDYNNNEIPELDEFEIAVFQDQANYLRVVLPTISFIKTNQNIVNNILNFNFSSLANSKSKFKKIISHFINQTSYTLDSKHLQENGFIRLNPFKIDSEINLALLSNFKNSLYFNRGKQYFSTTISYLNSKNKTLYLAGNQENNIQQIQTNFTHLFKKQWLLNFIASKDLNTSFFQNFTQRNFEIKSNKYEGKITYLQNKIINLGINFTQQNKENLIENTENLSTTNYGAIFKYQKDTNFSINSTFNIIDNKFNGNINSAVAFQMLEGLQNGKNYTWMLLIQKKINSFLSLNLNYNGRKSETSKTIHVGSIRLRADF